MSDSDREPEGGTEETAAERMVAIGTVVLHPDHPMHEARARMREGGLAAAPVLDGDEVVGILSLEAADTDEQEENEERRERSEPVSVRDAMRTTVPFLYESEPVSLGAAIAAETGCRHFCVITPEHHLTGFLSYSATEGGTGAKGERPSGEVLRRHLSVSAARGAASRSGGPGTYEEAPAIYFHGPTPGRRGG